MKLRNKKTGEIVDADFNATISGRTNTIIIQNGPEQLEYGSLAELNAEWEDYEEPKEWYWFIEDNGVIQRSCHYEDLHPTLDKARKEIGNYFETKEEAEKAVEKLKAWKRLKDNGFNIKGWKFTPDMKQIQGNYVKIEAEIPQILINEKDIDLLFGGEE